MVDLGEIMKKILFLIFGLISFSASADMEKMWQQSDRTYTTTAWCVFENEYEKAGFIYLYINHKQKANFEVVPYGSGDIGAVCERKPKQ